MGSSLNLPNDINVTVGRMAEKQKAQREKIDTIEGVIFGNGKRGLVLDVSDIRNDVTDIKEHLENSEMSKRWKIGIACGVAMALLGNFVTVAVALAAMLL